MRVVNIKTGEPFTHVIDRRTKFGNPFRIGRDGDRERVVQLFEQYARVNIQLLDAIRSLPADAVLGCWCKPEACHGDVIVRLWEEMQMKLGTHVQLPDGRVGTVVYSSLAGIGIRWGLHDPHEEDFAGTSGDIVPVSADSPARDPDWPWKPEAMLRGTEAQDFFAIPCVGRTFVIID